MNKQQSNIGTLKKFDPLNTKAMAEILANDFIWHFINPALPRIQGDYLGAEGLADFFKTMAGQTGGTFKVNPLSITPIGDEFVVVHVKDNMLLNGLSMEVDALVLWHIVDGKIIEAWDIPALHTAKIAE